MHAFPSVYRVIASGTSAHIDTTWEIAALKPGVNTAWNDRSQTQVSVHIHIHPFLGNIPRFHWSPSSRSLDHQPGYQSPLIHRLMRVCFSHELSAFSRRDQKAFLAQAFKHRRGGQAPFPWNGVLWKHRFLTGCGNITSTEQSTTRWDWLVLFSRRLLHVDGWFSV